MSESKKPADVQKARQEFNDALRGMERFVMNMDPGSAHVLRDWLRAVDAGGRPDRISAPSLNGLPLAEQIGLHVEGVLAARAAWRKSWRLHHPSENMGATPWAGLH